MYTEINQLIKIGLNKSQVARKMKISRPTLDKYLAMSPDEFDRYLYGLKERSKKPDPFEEDILCWLKEFPGISAAQIYDWLEERYKTLPFSEGTLRRYICILRQKYKIPKTTNSREYTAVDELPMGKQMQVDFGTIKVPKNTKGEIRLYVMCFVLSHSRYKYCEWQDRPFNTDDIIRIHENAFEFFGGVPEEAVYDQDHLILTSENHGDLIFTQAFSGYLQKRKFRVYMCRKADPESKGKVEKVVDYVKNNYARHRTFYNIDQWNEDCLSWIQRRGNGKVHGTTRKIPAEVFIEEKKYLRPVLNRIKLNTPALSLTYQVRKDNTVLIKGNRYTVPKGTYKGPHTYVKISYTDDNELIILELDTDKKLGQFKVPVDKGNLIRNNDHVRDKSRKVSVLIDQVAGRFSDSDKARIFMESIRLEKPRYIRDQVLLIQKAIMDAPLEVMDKALDFCVKNRLFRATDFQDAMNHFQKDKHVIDNTFDIKIPSLTQEKLEKIKVTPKIRDMSEYINALGGKQ
ncbi:MAG: IS21 family transposase [Clostridiaceae bacterium]|nr:IS21 family transposase [Clostridiaceae bacterium]